MFCLPNGRAGAPKLDYEIPKPRGWRGWRVRLDPRTWVILAVCVSLAAAWIGWRWRLKEDEKAFLKQADLDTRMNFITFQQTPTPASLRYIARLPGEWSIQFSMSGKPDPVMRNVFEGRPIKNVVSVHLIGETYLAAWLHQMSVPTSKFQNVARLSLWGNTVCDKDLVELSRPDSGLKSLRKVSLYGTKVTSAGILAMQKGRPEVIVSK